MFTVRKQAEESSVKKGIITKILIKSVVSRIDVIFAPVHRRVGGLEDGQYPYGYFGNVHRRVGGLEVSAGVGHIQIYGSPSCRRFRRAENLTSLFFRRSPPYRWFRSIGCPKILQCGSVPSHRWFRRASLPYALFFSWSLLCRWFRSQRQWRVRPQWCPPPYRWFRKMK